jgi:hypothetical protein
MVFARLTKLLFVEGDDSRIVAEAVKKDRFAEGKILRSQVVDSYSTCSSVQVKVSECARQA